MTSTRTAATSAPSLFATHPNIGVYTNPAHDLWVAPALPSLDDIQSGACLREGEVAIAVRCTGICG